MANKIKLTVVTPDGVSYSGEADMVTLPSSQGQLGIYPNHVPLVAQLVPGEIIVQAEDEEAYLVVGEGFARITADSISVLTDIAVAGDTLDEARAEEARRRAEARMAERKSAEEVAALSAAIAQSLANLKIKGRR